MPFFQTFSMSTWPWQLLKEPPEGFPCPSSERPVRPSTDDRFWNSETTRAKSPSGYQQSSSGKARMSPLAVAIPRLRARDRPASDRKCIMGKNGLYSSNTASNRSSSFWSTTITSRQSYRCRVRDRRNLAISATRVLVARISDTFIADGIGLCSDLMNVPYAFRALRAIILSSQHRCPDVPKLGRFSFLGLLIESPIRQAKKHPGGRQEKL